MYVNILLGKRRPKVRFELSIWRTELTSEESRRKKMALGNEGNEAGARG